jgi:FkbM family methyltransferase
MSLEYYYFDNISYPIKVTTETTNIARYTFPKGGKMWETKSIQQFFNVIPKEDTINIVDIGAQVGLYSLFSKFLPKSTFYAFEPFPATFKELNENIKLNNIDNVKTFNLAISDKETQMNLNTSLSHNGLHTLGTNPLRFTDIKPIPINTTTLDIFFKDIPIHFIKIDTEGHEYFILKGGIEVIKRYKPIIQLEWNVTNMQQCNVNESMMHDLIQELGYKQLGFVEEEILLGPIN